MSEFQTPVPVPAWALGDLLMVAGLHRAGYRIDAAIDAATHALDEGGFDVRFPKPADREVR